MFLSGINETVDQWGTEMFDMKKQLRWSKLKVGLVITLALLILFIAIIFAGTFEGIISPKIELKAQFRDVKGLRSGAPVWIFGTEIGSVKKINLDPVYGTIVTISVNKSARGFIKKDSEASILTMGLLGDKYVELNAGSALAEPVHPGEMIKGTAKMEFTDIMGTSAETIARMTEFINKLDTLVTQIEKGEGTVTKLLTDPAIFDNLKNTTQTLSLVLEDVKKSRGTLRMLIEDPSVYNKILTATSSIEEMSRTFNESSGALKRFVQDPSLYDKMLAATSSIEAFSKTFNESSGTLKRLIEDPSLYDKMLAAVSELEAFSSRLKEGNGTLKKLVEDPELYQNLQQGSKYLSSILGRVDKGEGMAGALIRDEELTKELKETFEKLKGLTVEADELTVELKALMKDIKENPKKYFKFSLF